MYTFNLANASESNYNSEAKPTLTHEINLTTDVEIFHKTEDQLVCFTQENNFTVLSYRQFFLPSVFLYVQSKSNSNCNIIQCETYEVIIAKHELKFNVDEKTVLKLTKAELEQLLCSAHCFIVSFILKSPAFCLHQNAVNILSSLQEGLTSSNNALCIGQVASKLEEAICAVISLKKTQSVETSLYNIMLPIRWSVVHDEFYIMTLFYVCLDFINNLKIEQAKEHIRSIRQKYRLL